MADHPYRTLAPEYKPPTMTFWEIVRRVFMLIEVAELEHEKERKTNGENSKK